MDFPSHWKNRLNYWMMSLKITTANNSNNKNNNTFVLKNILKNNPPRSKQFFLWLMLYLCKSITCESRNCLKNAYSFQIVKMLWGHQTASINQIQEILSSGICLLEWGSFESFTRLFHSSAAEGTKSGMNWPFWLIWQRQPLSLPGCLLISGSHSLEKYRSASLNVSFNFPLPSVCFLYYAAPVFKRQVTIKVITHSWERQMDSGISSHGTFLVQGDRNSSHQICCLTKHRWSLHDGTWWWFQKMGNATHMHKSK